MMVSIEYGMIPIITNRDPAEPKMYSTIPAERLSASIVGMLSSGIPPASKYRPAIWIPHMAKNVRRTSENNLLETLSDAINPKYVSDDTGK